VVASVAAIATWPSANGRRFHFGREIAIALPFEQRALEVQAGQIGRGAGQPSGTAPMHLPGQPDRDDQAGDGGQPQIWHEPDGGGPRRSDDGGRYVEGAIPPSDFGLAAAQVGFREGHLDLQRLIRVFRPR
jgi:hypothetical protein